MNSRLVVIGAAVALAVTGCTGGATRSSTTSSPSTSATKTYVDPAKWASVYCGSVLEVLKAGAVLKAQQMADPVGVKAALVKMNAANATVGGDAARQLEELGPPGPDVEDAHRTLVQVTREGAEQSAKLAAPLERLEPTADFWSKAQDLLSSSGDVANVQRLAAAAGVILTNPKYVEPMKTAPECVEMVAVSDALGFKTPWS